MSDGNIKSSVQDVNSAKDINQDLDIDFLTPEQEAELAVMQATPRANESNLDLSLDQDFEQDSQAMLDDRNEKPAKNSIKLWIGVGVVGGLCALGLFAYTAMSVLGGSNQPVSSLPQSQFGQQAEGQVSTEIGAANGFNSADSDVEALANSLGNPQPNGAGINSAGQNTPVQLDPALDVSTEVLGSNQKDIIITEGVESLGESAKDNTEASESIKPSVDKVVTEEERLYDNLLSSVEGMDVPPEAIKIDQGVINRKLESQRLNSLEQEIKEARASMSGMHDAVEGIRNQVSGFAKVIEKNSADQAAISESIAVLTTQVKKATELQEKEIASIKASVAKMEKVSRLPAATNQAVNTPAVSPAKMREATPAPVQVAAQSVVVREPIASATAIVPPTKVFSGETKPAVVSAPTTNQQFAGSELPAHCNGTRVSANWRVKGVNSHSAYVVRSQDQQGMYLKVGVDVPGYGQVQAFDANNRSVCTTNGLIRR